MRWFFTNGKLMIKFITTLLFLFSVSSAFGQLAAPTINLTVMSQGGSNIQSSDGSYVSYANITFTNNDDANAIVCYTTDGSTPTAPTPGTCSGGTTQTTPLVGNFYLYQTGMTVNAIETEVGQVNSVAATYGPIPIEEPAPVFSINTGTYTYTLSVGILAPAGANAPPAGYSICYTTDSTTPTAPTPGTCSGGTTATYTGPITISSGQNIEITAILTQSTVLNGASSFQIYNVIPSRAAQTWYVRTDGGTRYSSNQTTGQCNGMYDASYASTGGTGINQNCAFNDVRYLWQDSSYAQGYSGTTAFPSWGWVIAGGDTVIIRGTVGEGVSYRIGYNPQDYEYPQTGDSYCNDANGNFIGCWGIAGNPGASGMPSPPSGTSSRHTIIEGENFAACHADSVKTQLYGGSGVGTIVSYVGASYVDMACLDITDHSNCGRSGQVTSCYVDGPNETGAYDYANTGVQWYNTSTYDTLTDARIHGIASAGMGGAPGTGTVLSYIDMMGNSSSGWNADDGSGTSGVGSLLVQHFNVGWNGCSEEYPIIDPVPYFDCTDQSSGGYGDGFGTATIGSPAPGWQVHWDQGNVFYNTQDGLDALHISGPGSTMTDTRVLAYGNEGQQLKVGGATATIQDSVIVGNCTALGSPIPGTPSGYNSNYFTQGSALCRAANTGVVINVTPGDPAYFQNNTLYSAGAIGLEVEYGTYDQGSTNTLHYNNNIFVGFPNGAGKNTTAIYSNTNLNMLTNPGASFSNNIWFNQSEACPTVGVICEDPGLVDETYHLYSYGNMSPLTTGSVTHGAGLYIASVPLDFAGVTRANPPSIGAYEINYVLPLSSILITPSSVSTVIGEKVTATSQCVYTGYANSSITLGSNSYLPCSATWTDTGSYSSVNSVTGVITGTSIGTDTVTATVSTFYGTATVTIAAPMPFAHVQGLFQQGITY